MSIYREKFAMEVISGIDTDVLGAAYIEYSKDDEKLTEFIASIINEYCRILMQQKEAVDRLAAQGWHGGFCFDSPELSDEEKEKLKDMDVRHIFPDLSRTCFKDVDDRSEKDEQSEIALSSDFDKSEKDCMWEERE